jgi:hypothetical protein
LTCRLTLNNRKIDCALAYSEEESKGLALFQQGACARLARGIETVPLGETVMNMKLPLETEPVQCATDLFPREQTKDDFVGKHAAHGNSTALEPLEGTASNAYICSMHPQIHRGGPGVCPICHLRLKPATACAMTRFPSRKTSPPPQQPKA